jgi:hypothetical protein
LIATGSTFLLRSGLIYSGPPVYIRIKLHRGQQCHRFSALSQKDAQKDAPEKKDAGFLVCTVSSIKAQKEERHRTTEGRRKKGEMVGSESADGQV